MSSLDGNYGNFYPPQFCSCCAQPVTSHGNNFWDQVAWVVSVAMTQFLRPCLIPAVRDTKRLFLFSILILSNRMFWGSARNNYHIQHYPH